jgi:hypothetical protein
MRIVRPALLGIALVTAVVTGMTPRAQTPAALPEPVAAFDQLLDQHVVEGNVYYRALKAQRAPLDRFVESLKAAVPGNQPYEAQVAFWINAYNALVIQTVADHYPIAGSSPTYPAASLRQIPGAFDRLPHQVAGRTVTLDEIEQNVLPAFKDPRAFFALGRAAVGGPRLRSEVYTADRLERQLSEAAAECADHEQCLRVDRLNDRLHVSAIFAWRQAEFIAAYADRAGPAFSARSPIERAIIGLVLPSLYGAERDFLERSRFQLDYLPFDWTLNDMATYGAR